MKRQIFYPNEILTDTMLSNQARDDMNNIGRFMQSVMGTANAFDGLPCTASVSTMSVNVGTGVAYSLQNVDNTAYGSIGADLTHQTVKIGKLADTVNLLCPAPTLVGKSINYLVQAAFVESDGGASILQFYNSSNPSMPYSGPLNDNSSSNTVRDCVCSVSIKAGTPATTGSQTTPAPDAGYTGLYVVTVAYGATSIIAGNITTLTAAPFIPTTGLMPTLVKTTRRGLDDYNVNTNNMTGDRIIGDDGKTYKSSVDNNKGNTPSTSPTFWERWGFSLSELWAYLTTGLYGGACPNTGPASAPTLANPYLEYTSALGEIWRYVGGVWKVVANRYGAAATYSNNATGGTVTFGTFTAHRPGRVHAMCCGYTTSAGSTISAFDCRLFKNGSVIANGARSLSPTAANLLVSGVSAPINVTTSDVISFVYYAEPSQVGTMQGLQSSIAYIE